MNGNNNNNGLPDIVNGIDMRQPLAALRMAVRQRGGVLANNAGYERIRRVAAALAPVPGGAQPGPAPAPAGGAPAAAGGAPPPAPAPVAAHAVGQQALPAAAMANLGNVAGEGPQRERAAPSMDEIRALLRQELAGLRQPEPQHLPPAAPQLQQPQARAQAGAQAERQNRVEQGDGPLEDILREFAAMRQHLRALEAEQANASDLSRAMSGLESALAAAQEAARTKFGEVTALTHPRLNHVETDLWEKLHYVMRELLLPLGRRLFVVNQVGEQRGAEWRKHELKEMMDSFDRYFRLVTAALDHGARVAIHFEPNRPDYNQAVKEARKRAKIDEEDQAKKRGKVVCRFCQLPGHVERICPSKVPAPAAAAGGAFRGRGGAGAAGRGAAPGGGAAAQ
jgi:hypothetical protein